MLLFSPFFPLTPWGSCVDLSECWAPECLCLVPWMTPSATNRYFRRCLHRASRNISGLSQSSTDTNFPVWIFPCGSIWIFHRYLLVTLQFTIHVHPLQLSVYGSQKDCCKSYWTLGHVLHHSSQIYDSVICRPHKEKHRLDNTLKKKHEMHLNRNMNMYGKCCTCRQWEFVLYSVVQFISLLPMQVVVQS